MHPRNLTIQTILKKVEYHGQVWFIVVEINDVALAYPKSSSQVSRLSCLNQARKTMSCMLGRQNCEE